MKRIFLFALSVLLSFFLVYFSTDYACTKCGHQTDAKDNYCSNCGAILSNDVNEDEKGSEGLEYHLKSDGTYSVAWGTTNLLDKIVIPKIHNGKLVTEIEERHMISRWNAKEIIIPDSITTISENAFSNFHYLTDFVVPDHITSIEAGAFSACVNLKRITLPNTIKTIEASTFRFCISLEEIVLPSSVEEICYEAFAKCYQLTSITIPESVVNVDQTAFNYCVRLVEVINYSDLNFEVHYKKRIVHQGESLIRSADEFKFITIDGINYLISYVGSDEKITLPESYNGAAYELLPSSLAYLTNYGYPSSINVKEIIIPKTIKMIPEYTFSESNITDIHYLGTKAEWNNLILEENWDSGISSTKIHCTDGDVE